MALKCIIDDLVEVPGPLREDYKKGEDGKYHLQLEGDPPKLKEFRDNNVVLMKERDSLKAQIAELQGKPDGAKELEAELAAERAAHARTQLRHIVAQEFSRQGGRPSAADHVADDAAKVFEFVDGKIATKEFSAADPSLPLSVEEWIGKQAQDKDYLFLPSRGGGAGSTRSGGVQFGARTNQKVLKNPTPQDLGAHAAAIARGDIKVEYTK